MKVDKFLENHGVKYEKHLHPETYTSQDLARKEGVSSHMVAKPVIVKGKDTYTMFVLPAPMHLELDKAADVLHEPEVRLATEDEMTGLFPDCELGAEPPFGPLFDMKMVMDSHLHHEEYLIMQAGSHKTAIKMRRDDWEKCCEPEIAEVAS
ncbi:MAG: aminoacyl-tRNA deacylase [Planctomycetota bacterium]|jgi:Ala-tRNA(Pro) deacylase